MSSSLQSIVPPNLLVAVACLTPFTWLFWRILQANTSFPDIETKFVFFAPPAIVTRLFSFEIPGLAWVNEWTWRMRYEGLFGGSQRDIVAVQSVYPTTKPWLLIADPVTVKAIGQSHSRFPKPRAFFAVLRMFGPNILGSEGAEWRRHRRIANPSFNESNNRLVWDTSIETIVGVLNKWIKEGKGTVMVNDVGEWTEQVALMVFCSAGFGYPTEPDADHDRIPEGRRMSFRSALRDAIDNVPTHTVFPGWMLRLFPRGRHTIQAFDEIEAYILKMIEERQMSASEDRKDLLTNLIRATQEEEKTEKNGDGVSPQFSQQDVIANIFVFLFAGHDSTAHTLAFALILMAMYPDEQEKLYKSIRSAIPDGRLPTYSDIHKLAPVLSWIYETLRLYPIVNAFTREATEDCVLPTSDGRGVAVPKGTQVVPMVIALHYSPKHWVQPSTFKPHRFLGEYNTNAFLPFSMGARGCIGRRFSEVEQLAILTTILLEYRIEVMEEPQFFNETVEDRRGRILGAFRTGLLLSPKKVPLAFKPREGSTFRGGY